MDGAITVDFALTRFEAVDGARLEVEGTWSGVRGVRFVRPALVVRDRATGGERTLLADLEHKPWPANEGEPWVAAFPWPDGLPDVARTELAVAPSIVVPLARAEEAEGDGTVTVALDPVDGLRAELAVAAEQTRRLEAEVAYLRREREDAEALRRERDEARTDRGDRLRGADRTAEKLRAERDGLRDERDAALTGLERLAVERDALRQELDERDARAAGAARRREQALEERDAARREGERIAEAARAERDAARAEVETAAERAAARERERAQERLSQLRDQLDVVEDERDRALAEPAGVVDPPVRVERPHEPVSAHADWAARTAAILAVLVLLVLAITFLKAIA